MKIIFFFLSLIGRIKNNFRRTCFNTQAHPVAYTLPDVCFLSSECAYLHVCTRVFPYMHIDVTARACLVAKRYRNTRYTRANRRAITLGVDVGVRLTCKYVCILLHPSVHPDDTYLWWNVCWVAECVQLNRGTENREGERGIICKANGATWL